MTLQNFYPQSYSSYTTQGYPQLPSAEQRKDMFEALSGRDKKEGLSLLDIQDTPFAQSPLALALQKGGGTLSFEQLEEGFSQRLGMSRQNYGVQGWQHQGQFGQFGFSPFEQGFQDGFRGGFPSFAQSFQGGLHGSMPNPEQVKAKIQELAGDDAILTVDEAKGTPLEQVVAGAGGQVSLTEIESRIKSGQLPTPPPFGQGYQGGYQGGFPAFGQGFQGGYQGGFPAFAQGF